MCSTIGEYGVERCVPEEPLRPALGHVRFQEENVISVYNQAGDLAFRTDGPHCAAGRDAEGVE